jgi:diguanylate cyclase (GGDEF)-like protein
VTGALLFVAGAFVGAVVAWVVAVRVTGRAAALPSPSLAIPDDFELPSDTAMHIATGLDAEATYEPVAYVLVERCASRLNANCAIAMREVAGGKAYITTVSGGLDRRLKGVEVPFESTAGRAFTDGVPVVGPLDQKVVSSGPGDRRKGSGGGIAVPIMQNGVVYGALIVFGEPPADTPTQSIQVIGELIKKFGPVLVPAHAAMVAMRKAQTDELTGLPNRRAFFAVLNAATREKASVIALDIDHFKDVNDTLGHEAGDMALKHVAAILRDQVRWKDGDVAARVGGEEFSVWLPGATLDIAMEIAERMRAQVAAHPFTYQGTSRILTISLGVTAFPQPTAALENLMGVADSALYQAKRGGRNRVVAGRASQLTFQPPAAAPQ